MSTDARLVEMLRLAFEMRRARGARVPVDNALLPAGAPMYFSCPACFGDIILPEGYLTKPPLCYDCLTLRDKGLLVEPTPGEWTWIAPQFVLESGPFAGKTVTMAATTRVQQFFPEIVQILDALGHPEALVTDESSVSDFGLDPIDTSVAEQKLGVQFASRTERLVDVAARMRGNP